MLTTIPIYKMLLDPHSYLMGPNSNLTALELLELLPNHKNVAHKKNILGKDRDQIERYYENQLIIETKTYCRTLLEELKCLTEEFKKSLLGNNLEKLFEIITFYRLPYFKVLILEDLKGCNLFKGHLRTEIEKAESVETINKILRKYAAYSNLIKCIKTNY